MINRYSERCSTADQVVAGMSALPSNQRPDGRENNRFTTPGPAVSKPICQLVAPRRVA